MPAKNPTRILLVDDHELVSTGLRLLLEQRSMFRVIGTCGDCASARAMVRQLTPDVVLMDVELPDGDGIALTASLLAEFPALKVLVLTGRLLSEVVNRAKAAGARGCLAKTRAAAELLEAVQTVAAGELRFGDAGVTPRVAGARAPDRPVLPQRESEVLNLLMLGLRNKEIASELQLSVKTVETYRARLMKRFQCASPAELVRHAIRVGLASP